MPNFTSLFSKDRLYSKNMYTIELTFYGIGYKAEKKDEVLILHLNFSHLIRIKIPEEVEVSVVKEPKPIAGSGENQRLILKSKEYNILSNFAQAIKRFRVPEPYKSKGIIIHSPKDLNALKYFRKEGKRKN